MSGLKNGYDWAAYYAAVYEKERKHNTMLAGQVADLERKQEDYRDNLERIYASPFWKAVKPMHHLLYDAENVRTDSSAAHDTAESENNECYAEQKADEESLVAVEGWREIEIPDTQIVLLTYGAGALEQGIFEKIKSCFNKNNSCVAAYVDEDYYEEDPAFGKDP